MFSTKESIKFGWSKFKEHTSLSLLTTLFLLAASSISMDRPGFNAFFFNLALSALLLILKIGYTKIFLKINDGEKPKFTDIFEEYKLFFPYLGVSILMFLTVAGGLILLVIPGIFWAVRFSLAPTIVVDKKVGPIMAMKESYAMTKGMFWKLFGFWIVMILINIAGIIALMVGLLVSVPVSTIATTHVYRALSQKISLSNTPILTT